MRRISHTGRCISSPSLPHVENAFCWGCFCLSILLVWQAYAQTRFLLLIEHCLLLLGPVSVGEARGTSNGNEMVKASRCDLLLLGHRSIRQHFPAVSSGSVSRFVVPLQSPALYTSALKTAFEAFLQICYSSYTSFQFLYLTRIMLVVFQESIRYSILTLKKKNFGVDFVWVILGSTKNAVNSHTLLEKECWDNFVRCLRKIWLNWTWEYLSWHQIFWRDLYSSVTLRYSVPERLNLGLENKNKV